MTEAELWQAKLAQLFHDPFVKAFCQGDKEHGYAASAIARDLAQVQIGADDVPDLLWDAFAQDKVAALLSARLLGEEMVLPNKRVRWAQGARLQRELDVNVVLPAELAPDIAASGADRPVLGSARQVRVRLWRPEQDYFVVTHPLAEAQLKVPAREREDELLLALRAVPELLSEYHRLVEAASRPERLKRAWYLVWRRLPEELAARNGLFWPLQPADTRCPDHSIWDHLRVTSSLAFIPDTQTPDERLRGTNPARRPWLLSLWVGPARDFVGQARTGRDLWTGSMMLSELAFALIEPIVEALGPDAVLYPDLRANARADRWIAEQMGEDILDRPLGRTYGSLIPNRLLAVVPEGELDRLAEACIEKAKARWMEMAGNVRRELAKESGSGVWSDIFDRQVARGPALRWSAVRWDWDGRPPVKQAEVRLDPAIPFQENAGRLPDAIRRIEDERGRRFAGWIDPSTWEHYQAARQTAMMTHASYLYGQRGFDYALAHHQLLELDAARSRLGWRPGDPEPGEKCTLCGRRQALSNGRDGTVKQQRDRARDFWERLGDEGDGSERLCGICAIRRFLTDAEDDPIARNWNPQGAATAPGGRHAEPFPSTGLIAAQEWLVKLCNAYDREEPGVRAALQDVVSAYRSTGLRDTQFPDSLVRTRRLRSDERDRRDPMRALLRIDIQYLFPEKWDGLRRQGLASEDAARKAKDACRTLHRAVDTPQTGIAVIALDGDRMGRLLLGAKEQVRVRWRDVLHPDAVDQIRQGDQPWKVYWRSTLEEARLLGPSTHALISRALRHFANRILPWVVERQYGGRLIYAGGDDALILCPAGDALGLLDRLNELFTSAWVLDGRPDAIAWPDEEPADALYDVPARAERERRQGATGRFQAVKGDDLLGGLSGRVLPMLGPHQSFSAGIAFGHFKMSLRRLRAAALDGLQGTKTQGGRRAGLAWFTRNGMKLDWTAPLAEDKEGNLAAIQTLAEAFRRGGLPRRLPYKLREMLPAAGAIPEDHDRRHNLLAGLVLHALDGTETHVESVTAMWEAGLADERCRSELERSLGGLLLARALAGIGVEE